MFKKHLVRNANVKILVSNYGSIPREISEQSWIESSGAGQHLESTTVEKIPSISITKSENDELGLHQGGRSGSYRSVIYKLYENLNGMVFVIPKLTTPEQVHDVKVTLGNLDKFIVFCYLRPLLILMENNPSDSELQRSDKKAQVTSYLGNWMLSKVEYVDSLENKEEIEKNLVWLQEQVMNQILNPVRDHYRTSKKVKTGDDKPTTQKIFGKKTKSVEKTIAKEEKMVAKQEKKQTGILGWLFN